MDSFVITGGKKLSGSVTINSSKNAAVALLAASVLNRGTTTLQNVPQIEEVFRLVEIIESIGMSVVRNGRTFVITPPQKLQVTKMNKVAARRTRSVLFFLGALAGRVQTYDIPQAGGCRLGARTVMPHLYGLEEFGISITTLKDCYRVHTKKLHAASHVVLYESGDTVTENVLFAAAQTPGVSEIRFASPNYMVQEVCFFLQACGVRVEGIGTTTLTVYGKKIIKKNVTYTISEDPIEAMFFISSAITTNSAITIKRCPIDFLELELLKLEKMGFRYDIIRRYKAKNKQTALVDIKTYPSTTIKALADKIHAMPFPGINQDNLPFFVPIAARAKGETLIHDWTYEVRPRYYIKLRKLGVKIKKQGRHRVLVTGPSRFRAATMTCPPALRPGAIILVAMLGAKGKSILKDVYMINRGYENLAPRLRALGADISLVSK